jgi:type VI secretion system protein ImpA
MALPSLDDFLKPISPEAPCGEDLRYHPLTDQIKEARRREEDVSQGVWKRALKEADYKLVLKLCREALTKRGKDLQVVAWLTEALLYQEGIPGLLFGLRLLRSLLEQHWDTVYPAVVDDDDLELRATPVNWVGSQLDQAVKSVPVTRGGLSWIHYAESKSVPSEERAGQDQEQQEARQDAIAGGKTTPEAFEKAFQETPYQFFNELGAQLAEALESLQELSSFCDGRFGDVAPNLGGLRSSLEEVQTLVRVLLVRKQEIEGIFEEHVEAEPGDESADDAAPAEAAWLEETDAAAAGTRRRRPAGTLSAEPEDEQDAIERVLAAARFLRRQNPQQPSAYLLTRALRWGELRAAGPQPDFSLLEPPPTGIRVELKRLFNEGQYEQALDTAEEVMGLACGRAWLDLQRYSVRCCQSLGSSHEAIEKAIRDELKSLLAACPGLPEWVLADDTPAANAETRQWLLDEKLLPGETPGLPGVEQTWSQPEPPSGDESASPGRPPDAADLAMEAARAGRIQEAVSLLWREAAQESSGRARFVRRSQLARICLATGHQSIALPILQELVAEISARKLDEWEHPELVAQVLVMYYRALGSSEGSRDLRRSVYERLCRLDPTQAMQIGERP